MSQISEVKEATDIIQVIGERLQLQRTGSNWRGHCPFHSEKSPSFFVSEPMQRYKCFGCAESGDAFTFLEKYEGMTFGEALKHLAERAGITLSEYRPTKEEDQKEQLLKILSMAKEYYHFVLTKHPVGEPARAYLQQRGTSQESIRLFQIGYSQSSWDGLLTYLRDKKKCAVEDIEKAGLIVKGKTGRHYDRFRGRVMFPLTNHRGQVVGFSGRVLDATVKEAKYINSPETVLYHKSQMLFGYSELYQEIRKKKEVVVVEGEFDVISSAQMHVNHIVAIKGSALTSEHLKLLSRAAERVILSLDQDAAGVEATKRAIQVAKDTSIELRVVDLRGVQTQLKALDPASDVSKLDPDDLARHHPALWREAVKSSISVFEFFLQATLAQFDPATPEGKRHIMTAMAPVLSSIQMVVEQDVYIKKLAHALQVKEELIRTDMNQVARRTAAQGGKKAVKVAAEPETSPSTGGRAIKPQDRRQKVETFLLFLLFQAPAQQVVSLAKSLEGINWSLTGALQLVRRVTQMGDAPFSLQQYAQSLPEDLQQLLAAVSLNPEYDEMLKTIKFDKEWAQAFKELTTLITKEKLQVLEAELEALDSQTQLSAADKEVEQARILQAMVAIQRRV